MKTGLRRSGAKRCSLCQSDKLTIIQVDPSHTLTTKHGRNVAQLHSGHHCFLIALLITSCAAGICVSFYALFFYLLSSVDVILNHFCSTLPVRSLSYRCRVNNNSSSMLPPSRAEYFWRSYFFSEILNFL